MSKQVIREMYEARGWRFTDSNTATLPNGKKAILKFEEKQTITENNDPDVECITRIVKCGNIIKDRDPRVEVFKQDELFVNILKHKYQPTFNLYTEKISDKDKLPKIKQSDPVCKFLRFKQGDVIEIKYKSDIALKVVI